MGFLFPCDGFPRKAAVAVAGIDPPLSDYMLDGYQQEQFLKLYPTKDCLPAVVEFAPHAAYEVYALQVYIRKAAFTGLRDKDSQYFKSLYKQRIY